MGRTLPYLGVCALIGALAACSSSAAIPSPDAGSGTPSPDGASTCPTTQEASDGKITDADRARFEATSGSMVVIITVAGGGSSTSLPACPADRTQPCPERDATISQIETENLMSQGCVRALIAGIGGTADPTTLWLIDAFTATLTWDQIQMVAAHPDVIHVESNGGTPPP
jgi:hypothetical protein